MWLNVAFAVAAMLYGCSLYCAIKSAMTYISMIDEVNRTLPSDRPISYFFSNVRFFEIVGLHRQSNGDPGRERSMWKHVVGFFFTFFLAVALVIVSAQA